jgi:hypothetical protein
VVGIVPDGKVSREKGLLLGRAVLTSEPSLKIKAE